MVLWGILRLEITTLCCELFLAKGRLGSLITGRAGSVGSVGIR